MTQLKQIINSLIFEELNNWVCTCESVTIDDLLKIWMRCKIFISGLGSGYQEI